MNGLLFLALLFAALSGFMFAAWYIKRRDYTLSFWFDGSKMEPNKWHHVAVTAKPKEEDEPMNVRQFAVKVAKLEGKKKGVNIAQIMEILKVMRKLLKPTGLDLYAQIRKLKK